MYIGIYIFYGYVISHWKDVLLIVCSHLQSKHWCFPHSWLSHTRLPWTSARTDAVAFMAATCLRPLALHVPNLWTLSELELMKLNPGLCTPVQFSSVTQSCLTLFDPHGLQHARLPCPSSTPVAYSNSCPLSQWCHATILFSVTPFSSCLQSFPASASFLMSQLFASRGESTGASASASSLPMTIQD